jgi:flagellar motor switch protein FliN
MSNAATAAAPFDLSQYLQLWRQNICSVLEQISGAPFVAQLLGDPDREKSVSGAETPCDWLRFRVSGSLQGEQCFRLPEPHAVALAQLLMGDKLDPAAPYSEDYRDALGEIMRQFAGAVATAGKEPLGGEVSFSLEGRTAPDWQAAAESGFSVSNATTPPMELRLQLNAELAAALQRAAEPIATPSAQPSIPPVEQAEGSGLPSSVSLLLDVALEARLCFGERQMLLRDVLECIPGTVVEIHRPIQQPTELWVAGVLMARGEMVIVDGNYGLRITEIANPAERMASLHRL